MHIDLEVIRDTNLCLTFFEANILVENMKTTDGETKTTRVRRKPELLSRLKAILDNTQDPVLKEATQTLIGKLAQLSQKDYDQLAKDCQTGDLLFPANYRLPCHVRDESDEK